MIFEIKTLVNKTFHERIILSLLYFEKVSWMKFPFKVLRKVIIQFGYHCEIHPDSFIDKEAIINCSLPHPYLIIVNRRAILGHNLRIFHGVTIGANEKGENLVPVIRDNVYIGAGACILGGVIIGENAKIGAHSVVLSDVDPGKTACGIYKKE